MTSEAVKVAKINRKAQRDKMLYDLGLKAVDLSKDLLVAMLDNPAITYGAAYYTLKWLHGRDYINNGEYTAGTIALASAFVAGGLR